MMERFDTWVGKTLYIPWIIRLCQSTGWSQYRIGNWCWMIGILLVIYSIGHLASDWIDYVVLALLAIIGLFGMIRLGVNDNVPSRPCPAWLRTILTINWLLIFLFAGVLGFIIDGDLPSIGMMAWPIMLVHEYANTIDRIPPRAKKASRGAGKMASQKL